MPTEELKNPQDLLQTLRSLSHRTYLLFSFVFFGAFLGVTVYGIVPIVNNIITNYETRTTETENLKTLQSKKTQVEMIANDADYAQARIVEDVLYSNNPFLPMMYTLYEVYQKNGLADANIMRLELSPGLVATASAGTTTRQSATNRLSANKDSEGFTIFMEVRGTYHQLVSFLRDLENYAPFNSVAYSEIANQLNGSATGQFEIIAQYYPPSMKAKLEDNLPKLTDADKETLKTIFNFTIPDLEVIQQTGFTNYGRDNPFLPFLQVATPTELLESANEFETDLAGPSL
jgi:hypothetical protein